GVALRGGASPPTGHDSRRSGVDTGLPGVCPGVAAARVHLHRPGHGLRHAAGVRRGGRPPGRLLPPGCIFINTPAPICAHRFANHTWRGRLTVGTSNGGEVTASPRPAGRRAWAVGLWPAPRRATSRRRPSPAGGSLADLLPR